MLEVCRSDWWLWRVHCKGGRSIKGSLWKSAFAPRNIRSCFFVFFVSHALVQRGCIINSLCCSFLISISLNKCGILSVEYTAMQSLFCSGEIFPRSFADSASVTDALTVAAALSSLCLFECCISPGCSFIVLCCHVKHLLTWHRRTWC